MHLETSALVRTDSPCQSTGCMRAAEWLSQTVLSPMINAACIEPYDTLSHAVEDASGNRLSLGEIKPLAARKAGAYSTDWFVETAAGGLGSLVPFVLAGAATGKGLRAVGRGLALEGRAASLMANEHFAQIAGAGIYAALKRPQPGETRLGNAAGTVAGFAVFEAGNSLAGLSSLRQAGTTALLERSAVRLGTGFAGGVLQSEVSSLVGRQKLADGDQAMQSGVGGAFFNAGLGAIYDSYGRASENMNQKPGRSGAAEQSGQGTRLEHDIARMRVAANQARETSGNKNVVYIVIDSGFSPDALPPEKNILGSWDPGGNGTFEDPLKHGSIVLSKLVESDPQAKFMLIRAFDGEGNLIQTKFENGQIARPGWTEAYLEAVSLADSLNMPSVANCSFGCFSHAMDGTGWESFQLSHAIGPNKPGHAVVAAAGAGNGAARHASGVVHPESSVDVSVYQKGEANFNLWMGKDAPEDWHLSVYQGDRAVRTVDGSSLAANPWNDRQQVTFKTNLEGESRIVLSRNGNDARPLSFDYWVEEGKAAFLDHVNSELVSEPAVFPDVVAVGIKDLNYSPFQNQSGHKPDVLVPGDGPVSFRTPEVTLAVGKMLKDNPNLDARQIQKLLGKTPQL